MDVVLFLSLIIWNAITIIFSFLMVVAAIYFISSSTKLNKWKNIFHIFTLIAIISFFCATILNGSRIYLEWIGINVDVISIIAGFLWILAQTFIYLLLIHRMKTAFNNTKYQSSDMVYHLLYIGLILFILIGITKYIIIIISDSFYSPETFVTALAITNLTMEIIDLILSICLVYFFVHKLMIISIETAGNNINIFTDSQSYANKHVLSSLLDVIVKYTVLSIFAITITQLMIFYWALKDVYNSIYKDEHFWEISTISENYLWPIEVCINCICILLYLPNSDKWYNKICHGIHALCKLWFIKCAKKKMENKKMSELTINLLQPQLQDNIANHDFNHQV